MSNKYTKVIDGQVSIKPALDWLYTMIQKGLQGGAVEIAVYRHEDKRNGIQNEKIHAMFNDINKQAVISIPGKKIKLSEYDADECKALLIIWFANERALDGNPLPKPPRSIACPISGQLISIRPSTADMSKRDVAELVEWLYSIGDSSGVVWSEKASKSYGQYPEAQQ